MAKNASRRLRIRANGRIFLAALCIAAGFVAPCYGEQTNSSELMTAAKRLGSNYDRFYAQKDPVAMASLYTDDGILVSPSGKIVRGQSNLVEYYKARFASGARQHAISVQEVHALADGGFSISDFSVLVPNHDGALKQEHGHIVAIYQHDGGAWHMRLVQPSVLGDTPK